MFLKFYETKRYFILLMLSLMAGGRFKKEVLIDGQSYLLLIRDEGGIPEAQVILYDIM